MFTGIVTDVGEVVAATERAAGLRRLAIQCGYQPGSIALGASIACAGVCLTVAETPSSGKPTTFMVDVGAETLAVTSARRWQPGTRLNLERALRIGDELGGHIVTGHVDGLAEVVDREDLVEMVRLTVQIDAPLSRFVAPKGAVTLDGTSLTVNDVTDNRFSVLIIPHTLRVTTLGQLQRGDVANLEVDMMARYLDRLLHRPSDLRVP